MEDDIRTLVTMAVNEYNNYVDNNFYGGVNLMEEIKRDAPIINIAVDLILGLIDLKGGTK